MLAIYQYFFLIEVKLLYTVMVVNNPKLSIFSVMYIYTYACKFQSIYIRDLSEKYPTFGRNIYIYNLPRGFCTLISFKVSLLPSTYLAHCSLQYRKHFWKTPFEMVLNSASAFCIISSRLSIGIISMAPSISKSHKMPYLESRKVANDWNSMIRKKI